MMWKSRIPSNRTFTLFCAFLPFFLIKNRRGSGLILAGSLYAVNYALKHALVFPYIVCMSTYTISPLTLSRVILVGDTGPPLIF